MSNNYIAKEQLINIYEEILELEEDYKDFQEVESVVKRIDIIISNTLNPNSKSYKSINKFSEKPLNQQYREFKYIKTIIETALTEIELNNEFVKPVKNKVFMIMPFGYEDLNIFYNKNIKAFLKNNVGINVFRSDDTKDNDFISETILKDIDESEFLIIDTTYDNPNVFFEYGYAFANRKEIIPIQNKKVKEKIFFDRAHIRCLYYSENNIKEFQQDLIKTIQTIRTQTQTII